MAEPTLSVQHASTLEQCAPHIARAALPLWGFEESPLEVLKLRENAVFRVQRDDQRFVLRIHRRGYHTNAQLHSEFLWARALQQFGVAVPRAIPSLRGRDFELIAPPELSIPEHQVDVFAWIDGHHPGSDGERTDPISSLASAYRMIGHAMACIHNQSAQWMPPPGFERPAWNTEGLVGENPVWGRFWELQSLSSTQRQLMERLRTRLHAALTEFGTASDHYSLIHGDLVPDNVLVQGDQLTVIDFDDAGFGWHLFDLATSLYFISEAPHYEVARTALIAGYRSARTLTEQSLAVLPMFIAARGTTYLGWVHSRQGAAARAPWLISKACQAAQRWLTLGY